MEMRTKQEIQQAHNDIGAALVAFHTLHVEGQMVLSMHAWLDVLCWVLGCQTQDRFACQRQSIVAMLETKEG